MALQQGTTKRRTRQSGPSDAATADQIDGGTAASASAADVSTEEPTTVAGWTLMHLHQLPEFLKDNEYLLKSHRPELNSITECLKSAFQMHTETLNIWTHLLGCLGCMALTIYYLVGSAVNWPQRVTFAMFFAGAIFCLGASTIYHAFICYSEAACVILAKFDYCGIIFLIVSSFAPWLHFGFYCNPVLKMVYTVLVVGFGALSAYVVTKDKFSQPQYRPLRAALFIALGLTGVFPGMHFILAEGVWEGIHYYSWLVIMALLYIAGGLIYAARIPERYKPGTFDIWFQSHQILHLCVLGGVICCYVGASILAEHKLSAGDDICNAL